MEKLETVLEMYKKGEVTDYVLEREMGSFLGNRITVKLAKDSKNTQTTSYCFFPFPEFLAEGFHITYFVDEDAIRAINQEYRGIDKSTDVLSFPMIDYDKEFSLIRDRTNEMYDFIGDEIDYYNPDTREVALGDIVLCVPKIYSQAKEYNHSILREYAFLITHSMLHLLGFDHMEDDERRIMEAKQTKILESLDITRDL